MRHLLSASLLALGLAACGQAENKAVETVETVKTTTDITARTVGYSADKNVYFGDLHIHTKNSWRRPARFCRCDRSRRLYGHPPGDE